jgi:hypothetical protein
LNDLFASGAAGVPDRESVRAATSELLARLQADVNELSANDYLIARRFVVALQQVRLPAN